MFGGGEFAYDRAARTAPGRSSKIAGFPGQTGERPSITSPTAWMTSSQPRPLRRARPATTWTRCPASRGRRRRLVAFLHPSAANAGCSTSCCAAGPGECRATRLGGATSPARNPASRRRPNPASRSSPVYVDQPDEPPPPASFPTRGGIQPPDALRSQALDDAPIRGVSAAAEQTNEAISLLLRAGAERVLSVAFDLPTQMADSTTG